MAGTTYLTKEGLEQLRAEYDRLCNVERPAVVQAIVEARDKGDLSENAEYTAAREAQALLDQRISALELTLATARVLDPESIDTSTVGIHTKVTVKNSASGQESTYTIVSPSEADFRQLKISTDAPIAKALIGHKVGEVVEVQLPKGTVALEVLNITV